MTEIICDSAEVTSGTQDPALPPGDAASTPPSKTIAEILAEGMAPWRPEHLTEDDALLTTPASFEAIEPELHEQFSCEELIASGHFARREESSCSLRNALTQSGRRVLRLTLRGRTPKVQIAYDGCGFPSRLARMFLADDATLNLSHQYGGVLIAAPTVDVVHRWRRLGIPAIPIATLAAAPAEEIARFWRAVTSLTIDDAPELERIRASREQLKKQKKRLPQPLIDAWNARLKRWLHRDLLLCATTCSPALAPDERSVNLLQQLELFAPEGPPRVALWDPRPDRQRKILEAAHHLAVDRARDLIRESFDADIKFLPPMTPVDEGAASRLNDLYVTRGRGVSSAAKRAAVDREIVGPLLSGDGSDAPHLDGLRFIEAELLRRIAALQPASPKDPRSPRLDPTSRELIQLSATFLKVINTERKLENDRRQ